MAKDLCALCGTQLSMFAKKPLTCCGETHYFCAVCYDSVCDLNHYERTRIILNRGRPTNPEKMRQLLDKYDEEQAAKRAYEQAQQAASYTDVNCLRCNVPMRNLGKHFFKLGRYAYGNYNAQYEFFSAGSMQLQILYCDTCGKTEFFSDGTFVDKAKDIFTPEEEYVSCPVCGARHDPKVGCYRCAMNNATYRVSTAPKAEKKARPGEKPPWEK